MNILFAADVSIKNVMGGSERVLHEQASRLSQRGHAVYIITRRFSSHTCSYEKIDGVHEYRYDINKSNTITFLLSTIINGQKLFKQLSQEIKFDIINFHQPFSALAINLLRASEAIKKVYTCHSLSFEEYASRNPKRPFDFTINVIFRKIMERFSLDKCEKIIVLSQFTKDKLANTHGVPIHKIIIIPGAVDIDYFRPAPEKDSLRQKLGIPKNQCVLFTVRNLVPRMGLENLVKAMAILRKKGLTVPLIIGGQGTLKEKLQNLINEHGLESFVTLAGFLSKENLLNHYQMADFFILPTLELEGFGLVTVEAMACGVPVLGTPIGGTVEILNRFDGSFLFKDTSPESMAELIFEKYSTYKNKPDQLKQLSATARKFIEDNYSWEKNISELAALFTTLVSNV